MLRIQCLPFGLLVGTLALAACGTSPEAAATRTASAWTPTPPPTATSTPPPFDITVSVVDAAAAPIAGAEIMLARSGTQETATSNESGQASWASLPTGDIELLVTAQGYFGYQESMTLERGPNGVLVTLQRDPLQLLGSEACAPGQEALYLEDFEDKQAQDWEISRPAWVLEQREGHGTVLTRAAGEGGFTRSRVPNSGNTVWHVDFYNETPLLWFYQRYAGEGDSGSLANVITLMPPQAVIMGGSGAGAGIRNLATGQVQPPGESGWQHMSAAYFNGDIDVWIDGQLVVGVTDANPLESGDLALENSPSDKTVSYDNLVICALNEPFAP